MAFNYKSKTVFISLRALTISSNEHKNTIVFYIACVLKVKKGFY